jgi:hypothetical protein
MKLSGCVALIALAAAFGACSAGTQRSAIETAWDNDEVRQESFEATLRILDEHPEYVEEFFAAAQRHPTALMKFLDITSRELVQDSLAEQTADRLVAHPPGLKNIMAATMHAASDKPEAQDAIAQAMEARPHDAAAVLIRREQAMRVTFAALIDEVAKHESARRAFITSMRENSTQLATLMANDPGALGDFIKALLKVAARKASA